MSYQSRVSTPTSIAEVLKKYQKSDRDKYYSVEFQQYGYNLAKDLGDLKNKSLYIKLAKVTPRGFLESAKSFVLDAPNVKSMPKLFMWKLGQIKKNTPIKEEKK